MFLNADSHPHSHHRYDYLEFTDSKDQKRKFDQKVGTSDWPQVQDRKNAVKKHFSSLSVIFPKYKQYCTVYFMFPSLHFAILPFL